MKTYPIPMVPGPTRVPDDVMAAAAVDYGAADLERDFLELYNETESLLGRIMETRNRVAILGGEGMVALWGAMKSCIAPGDRALAISTGLFGEGIGGMARRAGAEVRFINLPFDQTLHDMARVEAAIVEFKPKMITVVHCETPSGTLNPLDRLGALKAAHNVPLLYVDAVSSIGGAPLRVDEWGIDLALGASQKCLSAPPSTAFVAVSDRAWEIIDAVDYAGYDALKPFKTAQRDFYFPYTPNWHGVASVNAGARRIIDEGLDACFKRHQAVAAFCRHRLAGIGLSLFPAADAIPSPTVTAVKVPEAIGWARLDAGFRQRGLVTGGNYGPMAGKVFRLGHMGAQADMTLMRNAMDAVAAVVEAG